MTKYININDILCFSTVRRIISAQFWWSRRPRTTLESAWLKRATSWPTAASRTREFVPWWVELAIRAESGWFNWLSFLYRKTLTLPLKQRRRRPMRAFGSTEMLDWMTLLSSAAKSKDAKHWPKDGNVCDWVARDQWCPSQWRPSVYVLLCNWRRKDNVYRRASDRKI